MNEELAINGGPKIIDPEKAHFEWPRINSATEKVVLG
jgi:hypothetical protein